MVLEHRTLHIIDFAVGNPKAVDHLLGASAHPAADGLLPAGQFHNRQPPFNGAYDQINVAGVPIVIAHERFQPLCWGTVGVAQLPGDLRLHGFGQRIHRPFELIMQLVAGAQQERIGRLQFLRVGFADLLFGFQILNQPQAAFEVHHPAEILVITQTAAAVLDVRLLHGHRTAVFVAARRLIFDALGNVFVDKRLHAFVVHLPLHPAKQSRLAGYQPGFYQSRFGLHILVGLLHAILHAPHGVPDLQAQIP